MYRMADKFSEIAHISGHFEQDISNEIECERGVVFRICYT